MNFYEILGVKNTDDIQTIKKAYKRLASKYHPDKNPGDETFTEKFKEINGAYEVLSDPEKRIEYDNSLNNVFGGFSSGGRSPSFNDIWGDMFNNAGRSESYTHSTKNPFSDHEDIFQDIFKDAFRSRDSFTHSRKNHFSDKGDMFDEMFGKGKARSKNVDIIETDLILTKDESKVGGVKEVYVSELKKNIKVRFPVDSIPGRTLKIKHDTHEILLKIKWFSRKFKFDNESNIIINLDIKKLKTGDKVKVKTVYDQDLFVSIPETIKIGSKLKLKEQGWQFKDGRKTDMFIKIIGDVK